MALYQNAESPGDWRSFLKRNDVRNLTLTEQKSKYQKEQLLFEDFIAQQAYLQQMSLHALNQNLHQGGNLDNKVESIAFAGTVTTISGFTSYVDVTFNDAVSIKAGGVPFIAITNGKEGNGTGSPINYIYSSGVDSKVLRFASSQVAGNNLGAVAANVLGASKVLSLAGVSEPLDDDPGTFANVTYTNGASSGITSTFDVTIGSLGFLSEVVDDLLTSFTTNPTNCAAKTTTGVTFATIGSGINGVATVVTTGTTAPTITGITITTPGSGYVVGEQLTIATGALGTGQLITTDNLLSQTTTAGIGNVTGPFTIAITSTSAVGTGGTITLTGDGANALAAVSVSSIGTGYVNGEVLTISNADLLTAGFAGATGDVAITLQASDVQDSDEAVIILVANDFTSGITAVTSGIAGENWAPGDVVTFADASFGATSTGGSIIIAAGDLTGDVLTLVGSSIDENGAEIYSTANNPGAQLDLSYTSTGTVTAVAS
jgi:hypothetical protein